MRVFDVDLAARGHLKIVTRPRGGDWLDHDLQLLQGYGVGILVSLLEAHEEAELGLSRESDVAISLDFEFLRMRVPDRSTPAASTTAWAFAENLWRRLEGGDSVALHCRLSVGRAPLLACLILMASGLSSEEAIARVSEARGLKVPETSEQEDWLTKLGQAETLTPPHNW